MINAQLKSALNTVYKMCDELEKTSAWDKSNTDSAKEIFRGELFHFLLNLSFVDGKITVSESDFIKDYLSFDYSVKEMREYAIGNRIYGSSYANRVPYVFRAFVKSDNENRTQKAKLVVNLYRQLGQAFVNCDGGIQNENYNLQLYCENMERYLDTSLIEQVNLTFGSLSEDNKKVSTPNTTTTYNAPFAETKPAQDEKEKVDEKPAEPEKTMDELMAELNELVGLTQIKEDVNSLINLVKIRNIRKERGMSSPKMSLHMVFSGNPGTGKTTIARLLAQIYKAMGLLSKGHLTEVDRSGLVGGYVGQTALKVQEVVQKAKGGVLFIDEAYSLTVNRGATDYGFEAVDTLLKYMEDNRDDLIVIVAGYTEPMEEFLQSNPGLKSRFNKYLYFEDYSPEELIEILKSQANKNSLVIDEEALNFATEFFKNRCENKPENYANARDVRNFFEKALVNQANRVAVLEEIRDEDLTNLVKSDFENITL